MKEKHVKGSLVKVYNAEAYRTSNKHYYFLHTDDECTYLFTENELGDASERAKKNREDYRDVDMYSADNLIEAENDKFKLTDWCWICCGTLVGVVGTLVGLHILS